MRWWENGNRAPKCATQAGTASKTAHPQQRPEPKQAQNGGQGDFEIAAPP